MKIKNKRGITLVALIVTIIVMIILFGITYTSGTALIRESQKEKMKSMLYLVQGRAQILLDDYLFNHDGEDLKNISDEQVQNELKGAYATKISQIADAGYDEKISGGNIPPKDETIYCIWDATVLKSQGIDIKNLADGDRIVIEYDIKNGEVDVASENGYVGDLTTHKTIHSLKDFID